jgi:uncharacterized protein
MEESRNNLIETLSGSGKLDELKKLLEPNYTQEEIDNALINSIAYSQNEMAKYLISLGADISYGKYEGVYYAVHNNELEGLKFALCQGVDVNINDGQLINTSIVTAYNTKDVTILKYLLEKGADTSLLSEEIMNTFGTNELKEIILKTKQQN